MIGWQRIKRRENGEGYSKEGKNADQESDKARLQTNQNSKKSGKSTRVQKEHR
jgi:hypothetical protein